MVIQRLIRLCQLALFTLLLLGAAMGCRDEAGPKLPEGFSFSTDTLRLDTLYSEFSSSTRRVMLYNGTNRVVQIQELWLQGGEDSPFRVNCDGRAGTRFQSLEVAPRDSLYIFVEATFTTEGEDRPTLFVDSIKLHSDMGERALRLEAWRLNCDKVSVLHLTNDTIVQGPRPLFVKDSIVVEESGTLTLFQDAHLIMGHDARIVVRGRLAVNGTADRPIVIEGFRRDELIPKVGYRQLPGQWGGIEIVHSGELLEWKYLHVKNGRHGVFVRGEGEEQKLSLYGCLIGNMNGHALHLRNCSLEAVNSLLYNCQGSLLLLEGGHHKLDYCTLANFFVFAVRQEPVLLAKKPKEGDAPFSLYIQNSIIDGSRRKTSPTGELRIEESLLPYLRLENCYLGIPSLNIDHAQVERCVLLEDPAEKLYESLGKNEETDTYHFVYSFIPLREAPFVGKGMVPAPSQDLYGRSRNANQPTVGALEPSN